MLVELNGRVRTVGAVYVGQLIILLIFHMVKIN